MHNDTKNDTSKNENLLVKLVKFSDGKISRSPADLQLVKLRFWMVLPIDTCLPRSSNRLLWSVNFEKSMYCKINSAVLLVKKFPEVEFKLLYVLLSVLFFYINDLFSVFSIKKMAGSKKGALKDATLISKRGIWTNFFSLLDKNNIRFYSKLHMKYIYED